MYNASVNNYSEILMLSKKEKKRATESTIKKLLYMKKEGKFNDSIAKYSFPHALLLKWYQISIENNDIPAVKRLCVIEQMGKVIGHNYSISPLHSAAEYGRTEIIDVLISNGYHVNSKLSKSEPLTPLHVASSVDVVNCLAKHGANLDVRLFSSEKLESGTLLYFAAISGNYKRLELLYNHGASIYFNSSSALSAAICDAPNPCMGEVIKFLCGVGCNPLLFNGLEGNLPVVILINRRHAKEILEQDVSLDVVHMLFKYTINYLLKDIKCAPNNIIMERGASFINLLNSSKQFADLSIFDKNAIKEFYINNVYRNFLSFCLVDKRLCNSLLGYKFEYNFKPGSISHLLPTATIQLIGSELAL